MNWLAGKKTYIIAVIVGICAAAEVLGYHVPEWLLTALGAGGLVALRIGVGKSEPPK